MKNEVLPPDEVARLISFIESIGGGYPLIAVSSKSTVPKVLWQYEHNDILFHCNGHELCLPDTFPTTKVLQLEAPSLEQALNLIFLTEKQRQQPNNYPFVRFGSMPVVFFP